MQIADFHRGEISELATACRRSAPGVWRLARSGFVAAGDPHLLYIEPLDDPDVIEALVTRVLAAALTPARRQAIDSPEALDRAVLAEAEAQLTAQALKAGREVSLAEAADRDALPEGTPEIAALVVAGTVPEALPVLRDPERLAWAAEARAELEAFTAGLEDRYQRILQLRFVEGRTHLEVAAALDCGRAAIVETERKLRHHARHHLRRHFAGTPVGHALLDALYAGCPFGATPPAITLERLERTVLRSTFQEEPPPYGRRLAIGLAFAAVAVVAWLGLATGLLPGPRDDRVLEPRVELRCEGPCAPGARATITVVAPRRARKVAVALASPDRLEPLLTGPTGGSVRLPIGAQRAPVDLPYAVTLPPDLGAEAVAVAVFSEKRLGAQRVLEAAGGLAAPKIHTASTTVARVP